MREAVLGGHPNPSPSGSATTWEHCWDWLRHSQGVPLQLHEGGLLDLRGHCPKPIVSQVQLGEEGKVGEAGRDGDQKIARQEKQAQGLEAG